MIGGHSHHHSRRNSTRDRGHCHEPTSILDIDEPVAYPGGSSRQHLGGLLFGLENAVEPSLEGAADVAEIRVVERI